MHVVEEYVFKCSRISTRKITPQLFETNWITKVLQIFLVIGLTPNAIVNRIDREIDPSKIILN